MEGEITWRIDSYLEFLARPTLRALGFAIDP